jgi:glycosyltransferase involved in cell wall biosynthesis
MMAFEEAAKIAQNASVGLALLKDIGDYSISYPTKMFEYMAAGLPLITSNFQHCLSIINSSKCGFGIVPDDEIVLAEKISWLIENQKEAIKMGEKGRKAVFQRYNWASEEQKLLAFYKVVLSN